MTWTNERIEAVEHAVRLMRHARDLAIFNVDAVDIAALARIGLAVLKAEPETVERAARAINDTRLPWQSDMLDTDALCARATAALAALRQMADTTPPQA